MISTNSWLRESIDPGIIEEAGLDGNELTIWQRHPSEKLQIAVENISHAAIPDGRWKGPLSGFSVWMETYLNRLELNERFYMETIADDAFELAQWFDRRCHAQNYIFRWHRLCDTMCPRFHTDYGPMRLLCTYRGPATEWVPNEGVDRTALNTIGTENHEIVPDPKMIQHMQNYSPAVLCGCDDENYGGVVHRSPEVPDGVSRFAFCMTLEV